MITAEACTLVSVRPGSVLAGWPETLGTVGGGWAAVTSLQGVAAIWSHI